MYVCFDCISFILTQDNIVSSASRHCETLNQGIERETNRYANLVIWTLPSLWDDMGQRERERERRIHSRKSGFIRVCVFE